MPTPNSTQPPKTKYRWIRSALNDLSGRLPGGFGKCKIGAGSIPGNRD